MRYLVKFKKQGDMIFISHLDTQRLFHRTLKRVKASLKYSRGFSPHPALRFAQPLPTGMSSVAEYMEFETERADFTVERWKPALNEKLPRGIEVISTRELPDEGKAVAALVARARYRISMPFFRLCREKSRDYMKGAAIFAEKKQKKTGETRQIDIRPMIHFFETTSMDNKIIVLNTIIDTGSASNLNPEMMTRNFCEYCGEEYDSSSVRIERTELFLSRNGEPVSADLFYAYCAAN